MVTYWPSRLRRYDPAECTRCTNNLPRCHSKTLHRVSRASIVQSNRTVSLLLTQLWYWPLQKRSCSSQYYPLRRGAVRIACVSESKPRFKPARLIEPYPVKSPKINAPSIPFAKIIGASNKNWGSTIVWPPSQSCFEISLRQDTPPIFACVFSGGDLIPSTTTTSAESKRHPNLATGFVNRFDQSQK